MTCKHDFVESTQPCYVVCRECGSYFCPSAPPPDEIYDASYWSALHGHSTIYDQVYNIATHEEYGVTKADFILRRIKVQDRSAALEIGCAPGIMLKRLREDAGFPLVVGVEFSDAYLEEIRKIADVENSKTITWIFGGAFPESTQHFGESSFSLVLAMDVLEHSHEPEAFLRECHRLLKPGGQLLLMLPLIVPHKPIDARFFNSTEHVWLFSQRCMLEMLEAAGFDSLQMGRWCSGHDTVSARRKP